MSTQDQYNMITKLKHQRADVLELAKEIDGHINDLEHSSVGSECAIDLEAIEFILSIELH